MRHLNQGASQLASVSHYRIEQELGRGGMGVVYRAHDEFLRRKVALKLLTDPSVNRAQRRSRILAEARAASGLKHPGITTIFEVGEDGEHIFIVMELLSGPTLRQLGRQKLPMSRVVRLGAEIAEVLAAAHAAGVVHGDVKPENIVIESDDRLKLLDFGIARQTAEETVSELRSETVSVAAAGGGTLPYMAPELFRGSPTSAQSDLFSLGVVLYELAAGFRPFPGPASAQYMAQILNEEPPQLARSGESVPSSLARTIHRLLEKRPEQRYHSARDLALDLAALVHDLEAGPSPPQTPGKRSLAVLPFRLLTPNPEDEYLSVALADALANELSMSGELLVRPMATVLRFAATDPLSAARELNAQIVVEGSIQKVGPRMRVLVRAWNAGDGSTLLSTKFDSEAADLFALQDSMAAALSRSLGMQSAPAGSQREAERPTKNPLAYELYLRALERLSKNNRWDVRTGVEMLQNAVELDPRFSIAWARLAVAQWLLGTTLDPGAGWLKQSERSSRRALATDPDSAEGHCARGLTLWTPARRFQNTAALRELQQALRSTPGNQLALTWKGCIFLHLGLLEDATQLLSEALASDPKDTFTLTFLGQSAVYRSAYEESDDWYQRALKSDPNGMWSNLFAPTGPLYDGRLELAEERIRNARATVGPDPYLLSLEGLLWAKRGERRKAEPLLARSLASKKQLAHSHHAWHVAAAAYAVLGKQQHALALLHKCAGMGLPNYPVFRDELHFVSLHNQPQFIQLINRLNREWTSYKREFASG